MDAYHTETKDGLTLKIVHDESCDREIPVDGDNGVIFCIYHKRDPIVVAPKALKAEVADADSGREFYQAQIAKGDASDWAVFLVYVYEHSGVVYRIGTRDYNPFTGHLPQGHAEFDTACAGLLALKRSEFAAEHLDQSADSIVQEITSWANGEVYGYVVEDEEGEHLDSCWGFIGDPDGYVLEEGWGVLNAHAEPAATAERLKKQAQALRGLSHANAAKAEAKEAAAAAIAG